MVRTIRTTSKSTSNSGADSRAPVTTDHYLRASAGAMSMGAAVVHFAVMFSHFDEYWLFGVFFLIVAWCQLAWAPIVVRIRSKAVLLAGVVGNLAVIAVYVFSRTTGLPIGPEPGETEPVGGIDVVATILESGVVIIALALMVRARRARPGAVTSTVRRARLLVPATALTIVVVTSAFLTPALAGPEGASMAGMAGMAGGQTGQSEEQRAMEKEGMVMVGDTTTPPTAGQIAAADKLITDTRTALAPFRDVNAATRQGRRPVEAPGTDLGAPREVHYGFVNPKDPTALPANSDAGWGLDPRKPSALVYAVDVPGHPQPVLLGALFSEPPGVNGPQPGGSLTAWHTHKRAPGQAADIQHMHVWLDPTYPGGPFSANDTLTGDELQKGRR